MFIVPKYILRHVSSVIWLCTICTQTTENPGQHDAL